MLAEVRALGEQHLGAVTGKGISRAEPDRKRETEREREREKVLLMGLG